MKRPPDCSKEEIETIGSKTIIVSNFVEKNIFFTQILSFVTYYKLETDATEVSCSNGLIESSLN